MSQLLVQFSVDFSALSVYTVKTPLFNPFLLMSSANDRSFFSVFFSFDFQIFIAIFGFSMQNEF